MHKLHINLFFAFVATFILSILPMPQILIPFRPPWTLLLVLYIEYYIPGKFHISTILLVGLVLDVLLSTVIGEHSLALLVVTWLASTKSRRFQFFSILQQIILVGAFCLIYQVIITLCDALFAYNFCYLTIFASSIFSMFIWPWLRLLGETSFMEKLSHTRN